MKVLIIEDVITFQRLLERVFDGKAECTSVSNGDEGFTAFLNAHKDKKPYDLIFLDIMLPGMGGLEILRQIRAIDPGEDRVKIIVITSIADTHTVSKAMKYGCDSYFIKPFRMEDIKEKLKELKIL